MSWLHTAHSPPPGLSREDLVCRPLLCLFFSFILFRGYFSIDFWRVGGRGKDRKRDSSIGCLLNTPIPEQGMEPASEVHALDWN